MAFLRTSLRGAFTAGIIFALISTVLLSPAASETFINPIVKQRADPFVLHHTDGFYYFTASVPEYDRIELRRAHTIQELGGAEPKVIWRKHDTGPMAQLVWAPELHQIDGKWYIYFAAGSVPDQWHIRIYVLENDSPDPLAGNWLERGQLKTNWESFSLDATTFAHGGKNYLVWAQHDDAISGNTNLYIAEMADPLHLRGRQVMISKPDLPWEQRLFKVNEGPAEIEHDGKIFLSYSASGTDANYCMGLLSAPSDSDLLDPKSWSKSPEPVFVTSRENSQFGPGHNCFTTSADGKDDVLVYHARNYERIDGDPLWDPNRATRAQTLHWKDGLPVFGVPAPDGVPTTP